MGRLVFADTSALVALQVVSDERHRRARDILAELHRQGRTLLTTDYVFDEFVTRVLSLAESAAATRAGESVLGSTLVRVVDVGSEGRTAAWIRFKKYRDHRFSFTDCTSFVVMERYGLREAFTFDGDFRKAGFVVIPAELRSRR
jgi:predicted nucleic acid-binding protein